MTPEETVTAGLPQGVTYQVNGLNEIKPVGGQTPAPPSQQATSRTAAEAILRSTGVDFDRGVDPVADLIRESTSGGLQRRAADFYGAVTGDATSGMENISALQTIQSDMTLLMTGGSLGAQISNGDRDFINQRMGDIANPDTPANSRLAAWEQVKSRLASAMGRDYTPGGTGDATDDPYPGVFDENGRPLGPQGGRGYDAEGNDLGTFVRVTADQPANGADPNGGGRSPLDDLGAGLGDVVQGAGDLVGLVGNPLNQTINAAFGTDLSTNLGQTARDLSGLPDNPNQLYSAINRGATGALLSAGLAGAAAPAMQAGTSRNVLNTLAQSPIRDAAAGAGAGAGAYAGQDYGPVGQVVGGLTGAIVGHGLSGIPGRMQAGRSSTGPQSLGQDAESLGIRMLPADTGGVGTRMATGVSRVTLGEIPIAAAADRAVRSAQTARGRVASDVGNVATDGAAAGQTISRGLNRWMSETGDRDTGRVSQLFEAVPIERETPLVLDNARQALTELTQGFKSNPQLSRIWVNNPRLRETLEALTPEDVAAQGRKDFLRASSEYQDATQAIQVARGRVGGPPGAIQQAEQAAEAARVRMLQAQRQAEREPVGGALSWGDASRLRSIVGEIIDQPGLAAEGNSTAALRRFYGALTSDMEQTAAQAGPRALTMWRRAVQYKRGRESRVNEVITSILGQRGEKSDEAVFQQLNRWTQQKGGDFRSLARTMRSMDADEANTVRATILDRMGNASAGRQNAAGDVFSPAQFVTEFNGLSPRARSVLFPQQEHRQAVEKLVRVMDGMKRAGDYNNTSKTALASNLGIGAVLVGLDQAVTAGLGALGSLVAGRILSSNRLAQMLSRAPRTTNPNARNEFVNRLGRATAGNPQLQADVQELQKAIMAAVNDNPALPANVAAGESDQQQ
jgi:hypothetical protein